MAFSHASSKVQDMRAHPAQLSRRIRAQAIYTGSPIIRNSYGSFTFIFQCPLSAAHVIYRALKKRMELLIPYYYYICLLFLSIIYHSLSLLGMAPCRLTRKCPNDMAETKLLHNYGPCRISCSGLPNLPKTVLLSHANAQIGGPLL